MNKFVRLGAHCDKIGSGATPKGGKETYLAEGPFSLIRSQNVLNSGFKFDGLAFIGVEQAQKLDHVAVRPDDVLVNITGDSVARVCQVHQDALPARVNQHVAIVRPRPKEINPRFLRYWLVSPAMQAHMLALASAGATRNALTKSMLASLPVPDLQIANQEAIAEILGSLDDKIELNRRMNETLEAMAQAIFRDWFVDFGPTRRKLEGATDPVTIMGNLVTDPDRAQELADLFPATLGDDGLPEGWVNVDAGAVMEILDSKRVPLSAREREKRVGPYPYHGATSVMGHVDAYLFDEVLLLVGEDGSVVRPDGKPFTQYVWGKLWVNNHAHVLKGKGISTEHLKVFFDQVDIAPYVTGAVQPKLNQQNMKRIRFPFSSEDINWRYGDTIAPLFEKIRQTSDEVLTLAATRDLLLPKLMSGEIRLGEAQEIVEAAE